MSDVVSRLLAAIDEHTKAALSISAGRFVEGMAGLYIGVYRQRAGWQDVQGLLRDPDTGPVVMSYSVSDSFPNRYIAEWVPPADDPDGDSWYDLPDGQRWDLAMAKLREKRWLELSPDTLAGVAFGPPVTVYDLLAPDRDERVARAFSPPVVSPGEQP